MMDAEVNLKQIAPTPEKFVAFIDDTANWFRRRARRANWFFNASRITLVVLSASLPALISYPDAKPLLPTIAAVLVAILAGIDAQFRPGDQWRHHRSTQLALMRCKRAYEWAPALNTEDRTKAFADLFYKVESLLETEASKYWMFRIKEWETQNQKK